MKPWLLVVQCLSASTRFPRRCRTPVRWLCLQAFCYLAAARGRRLEARHLDAMNQLMELGVFLNRCFDGKSAFCPVRYRQLRRGLPEAPAREYLRALREAERCRPAPYDADAVLSYRRQVTALSLDALSRLGELPSHGVLLPLVCLIQLLDDILDRRVDSALGLPTLVNPPGAGPERLARLFWQELKGHRACEDRPFVALGFIVYFLARLGALACR